MKKLFFVVTMTLCSTLCYAAGTMPWPGGKFEPGTYVVKSNVRQYTPTYSTPIHRPGPISGPTSKPIPQPVPSQTATPSLTSRVGTFLSDDNVSSTIQLAAALSNIAQPRYQQSQLYQHQQQVQPQQSKPTYQELQQQQVQSRQFVPENYDRLRHKADEAAIESFKQRGKATAETTIQEPKVAVQPLPCTETITPDSQVAVIGALERKFEAQQKELELMVGIIHRLEEKLTTAAVVQEVAVAVADVTTVKAVAQQDAEPTVCVQLLTALAKCENEDENFWKLRDVYFDMGCEERLEKIKDLPEGVCFSMPCEATHAFYLASAGGAAAGNVVGVTLTAFSGTVVGQALLATVQPLVMCAIAYEGGRYFVQLFENYRQHKHETEALKMIREAAENYSNNFQYALDRVAAIGRTTWKTPKKPIFYSMCYSYENDAHAKVVTIVDDQYKQYIFVVPDRSEVSAFQISHGDDHHNSWIPSRYFVSESVIDALNAQAKVKDQQEREARDKAMQNEANKLLAQVEKNLNRSLKKVADNKIASKEHLLPAQGINGEFKAARSKDGRLLRDETGAYFDTQGNRYELSKDEKTWRVSNDITKCDRNIPVPRAATTNPMDATPIEKPENAGCGHKVPGSEQPTSLPGGNVNN